MVHRSPKERSGLHALLESALTSTRARLAHGPSPGPQPSFPRSAEGISISSAPTNRYRERVNRVTASSRFRASSASQPRIERIPQSIPDDVERKHREEDC